MSNGNGNGQGRPRSCNRSLCRISGGIIAPGEATEQIYGGPGHVIDCESEKETLAYKAGIAAMQVGTESPQRSCDRPGCKIDHGDQHNRGMFRAGEAFRREHDAVTHIVDCADPKDAYCYEQGFAAARRMANQPADPPVVRGHRERTPDRPIYGQNVDGPAGARV